MQRWAAHATITALFGIIATQQAWAAQPGSVAQRESLRMSLEADVPSARCLARAVGRAVALRAITLPVAIPDQTTLRRTELAAVQTPSRRYERVLSGGR